MKSVSIDIAAELARLEALTNFELRGEWRRLHHMQPPKSLSRDLLLRGITYKIQERAFGGLSKSVLRKLSGAGPERIFGRPPKGCAPHRGQAGHAARARVEWANAYGPCPRGRC